MFTAFALTLLIIIVMIIAWLIAFPLLGGIIAISAGFWIVIIGAVLVMCAAILGILVATGIGVLLIGVITFIFTLVATILFPVLFPILLPLFILFLFISMVTRNKR